MTDTTDTVEDTSTAYVVYVPANGTDTTVESCLRLGAGPSSQTTTDETTTYKAFVNASDALTGLSSSTYDASSGIALVTPGAIHLLAAGGVNTTSGSYTNSTIGSSYSVTQDPTTKEIVSATYTNNNYGLWTTASISQMASNVAVNTIPLQASLQLGVSYALSGGPLSFANSNGASFNSTSGWSVSAQLARSVAIGWRTAVTYAKDGSNNEYYTGAQASSTGAGFSWTVPVALSYAEFDAMQQMWCERVNKAALAINLVADAYALSGTGIAADGSPAAVQKWLKGAEPIAIACTTLNAILGVMGLLLGSRLDTQARNTPANAGATTLVLGSGTASLMTKAAPGVSFAPALLLDANTNQITLSTSAVDGSKLVLDSAPTGATSLGMVGKGMITMNAQSLLLQFGTGGPKVTLSASGVLLSAGTNSVNVTTTGVEIAGQCVTIEALQNKITALETQIGAGGSGLAATNALAAEAKEAAALANQLASTAKQEAATAKEQAELAAQKAAAAAQQAAQTAQDLATATATK